MKGKRALHGGQAVDQCHFAAHLKDMEAVVAELVKSGLLKPE